MSSTPRPVGVVLAVSALLMVVGARQPDRITVERNQGATMRDAVVLRADIYRPSQPGRYPVLLQRTPYSKREPQSESLFRLLAANGFVVIVQDTRGRYTSDGVAKPHDESEDGFDTIAWARTLPYANGKVGMWGGSYLATTQLLAATLQPPGLVALFPSGSYNSRYDMVFQGGRLLSERRAGLEPGPGHGRPASRPHAEHESRRRDRVGRRAAAGAARTLALAPSVEVDGRAGAQAVRAGLCRDAESPERGFVLEPIRHRGEARPHRGAGVSPDRMVRHAAERHSAQLCGSSRPGRERSRQTKPAPHRRTVDTLPGDVEQPESATSTSARPPASRCRICISSGSRTGCTGPTCGPAGARAGRGPAGEDLRDGRERMARRAGVAAGARAHGRATICAAEGAPTPRTATAC